MNQSGIPSEEVPAAQAKHISGMLEIRVGASWRYVNPNAAETITQIALGSPEKPPAEVRKSRKPDGPASNPI